MFNKKMWEEKKIINDNFEVLEDTRRDHNRVCRADLIVIV